MSYNSGQIPTSATQPAKDLMDTLNTIIAAHAAWEFVEEVTGTGTNVAQVFKCLGTVNDWGTDFFISLSRTSLSSNVGVSLFETYNSTTKMAGGIAPYSGSTGTALAVSGTYGYATARHVANETSMVADTAGFLLSAGGELGDEQTSDMGLSVYTTIPTDYWIGVTNNMVVIKTRTTTANGSVVAGLYESFNTIAVDAAPLFVGTLMPVTSYQWANPGAFTRMPGADSAGVDYGFTGQVDAMPWTLMVPENISWNSAKDVISDKWLGSRLVLTEHGREPCMRGLLYPEVIRLMLWLEESDEIGDIITVDGDVHTCLINYEYAAWLNQSA